MALTCILDPSADGASRRKRYSPFIPTCTPSQTLTAKVGRNSQNEPLKTADEYFVRFMFMFVHLFRLANWAFLWINLILFIH